MSEHVAVGAGSPLQGCALAALLCMLRAPRPTPPHLTPLQRLGVTHHDLLHMDNTVQVGTAWLALRACLWQLVQHCARFVHPNPHSPTSHSPTSHSPHGRQMYKEVPPRVPWKTLMLRHGDLKQRMYYLPPRWAAMPRQIASS